MPQRTVIRRRKGPEKAFLALIQGKFISTSKVKKWIKEKMQKADLVIRVNLEIATLDYSDPLKIIEAGEEIARENIDKIKNLVT